MLLISLGVMVSFFNTNIFADDAIDGADQLSGGCVVDFGDDDDDILDLEAIKVWEKNNPPSFFKVIGAFVQDHISKNKGIYALGVITAASLAYYFRKHLRENKYKYLIGSTATIGLATLYAKYQFDQYMNQSKNLQEFKVEKIDELEMPLDGSVA